MRSSESPVTQEYFSLWVQDTMTTGNWTINAGLRYDLQNGENAANTVRANALVPDLMPAIDFPGEKPDFEWEDVVPRLGVTYALGQDRATLLRASFAQFADQLQTNEISRTNPTGDSYLYFTFEQAAPGPYNGEPLTLVDSNGIDPNNPTALSSPNVTDAGLDAPITSELILSVEHALLPEFVIGANVTLRNVKDILEERAFINTPDGSIRTERASDYSPDGFLTGTLPGGQAYNIPLFALDPQFSRTGGRLLVNGARERDYEGVSVNFTKRLANRWMLRGFVNYGEAEWDVPQGYQDNNDPNREGWITHSVDRGSGVDVDGATYIVRSSGSGKGERYLQSTWSANVNGMYQIAPDRPWGFNLSANLTAREGYPVPYIQRVRGTDGILRRISVVDDFDDTRMDDLTTVDVRLEKEFALSSAVNFTFGIDVFNLFNETTEMARQRQLNLSTANFLQDNVSPRIYRLGVRLGWK